MLAFVRSIDVTFVSAVARISRERDRLDAHSTRATPFITFWNLSAQLSASMGFIIAQLIGLPAGVRAFQVSDAKLTLKMLASVVAMAARRTDGLAGQSIQYCDQDGDWVTVASDADVVELFAVGVAMRPVTLTVRCSSVLVLVSLGAV